MSLHDDVTVWLEGLRHQDESAAQHLWSHYYPRLLSLAARRLPSGIRRDFDEEDVALSALDSLCRGVGSGRFPRLTDRDSLWALLMVITLRKCRARVRRHRALKRGGGGVLGESALAWNEVGAGISNEISQEPSPAFAAQIGEEVRHLLGELPDPTSRQLAIMKMEGYTNAEAAQRLGCSETTIKRRLQLIRKTWSQSWDSSDGSAGEQPLAP